MRRRRARHPGPEQPLPDRTGVEDGAAIADVAVRPDDDDDRPPAAGQAVHLHQRAAHAWRRSVPVEEDGTAGPGQEVVQPAATGVASSRARPMTLSRTHSAPPVFSTMPSLVRA